MQFVMILTLSVGASVFWTETAKSGRSIRGRQNPVDEVEKTA